MRFLIGIFTGAVVTLLVATAMDAPTHPILSNARDLAGNGWDRLINATSRSLFDPLQEGLAEERTPAAGSQDATPTAETVITAPVREPGDEPLAAPVGTESVRRVPAEPFGEDDPAAYAAREPAPALPPPDPVAESPSFETWAETALALERGNHANQPVWVPFHSQMSAEGFATRLSRALNHEFRVVRQGAGAYQVVFNATSADERALILAQVTEITGQ